MKTLLYCIVTLNLTATEQKTTVSLGELVGTGTKVYKVDFTTDLAEGEYDLSLNSTVKYIDKKDCRRVN